MRKNKLLFENTPERLSEVGKKRRDEGDIPGAVSAYRSALSDHPLDYNANAGLAEVYTEIDMLAEALNC